MSWVRARHVQVEMGGAAFFISNRLAVTACSCVPTQWRTRPETALLDPTNQARIPVRVVAENQEHAVALLEAGAPVAGISPLLLADGDPVVPRAPDGFQPGEPLESEGGVVGLVTARGRAAPAAAIRDLTSFYAKAGDAAPGPAGVVYAAAAEGLFLNGLRGRISPALAAKLLELGLDLGRELRPTYPRSAWVQMLAAAVAELFPKLSLEDGYHQLGEASIHGLACTPIGKAILLIARWQKPQRSLERLREGFAAVNDFMQGDLAELGPNHFRMSLNETYGCPAYFRGAIHAAMTYAGAQELQVVIQNATARAVSLDVRWRRGG